LIRFAILGMGKAVSGLNKNSRIILTLATPPKSFSRISIPLEADRDHSFVLCHIYLINENIDHTVFIYHKRSRLLTGSMCMSILTEWDVRKNWREEIGILRPCQNKNPFIE